MQYLTLKLHFTQMWSIFFSEVLWFLWLREMVCAHQTSSVYLSMLIILTIAIT